MNKKKLYAAAAASLLLLFISCKVMGPDSGPEPDGKTAVRIGMEASGVQGRTVLPAVALTDIGAWKLQGGKTSESENLLANFSGTGTTVYLETGDWHFTLQGYKNDAVILQGSIANQTITLDGPNVLAFTVTPVSDSNGAFKITILLPGGHGITEAKVFKDGTQINTVTPLEDRIVFEDNDYAAGDYYFSFRLYKNSDLYGVVSEAVQVRAHLRSEKTYTLGRDDLNMTYVITYHLNDGQLGGGVNPDYYRSTGAARTLPVPTRTGYLFGGWYNDQDLSGDPVAEISQGSTTDKDFYAKWTAITYTVNYDKNAADAAETTASSTHTYGQTKNLTSNGFTRTGYTFAGWNTNPEGTGTNYADEDEIENLTTVDGAVISLYARWTGIGYTVAYDSNGGDGGTTAASNHVYGTAGKLTANGFTRTGHTFTGWNTVSGGTGTSYGDEENVENLTAANGDTVTLYAQWTINTYTVAYHANGGSGTTESSAHTYGVAGNLTANGFTRTGYTFTGWNTRADNGGAYYTDSQIVTNLTSANGVTVILYAQWLPDVSVNISVWVNEDGDILVSNDHVTISKSASAGITAGFTAEATSAYSGVQWYLNGGPVYGSRGTARSITINAADYTNGNYYLGVRVTRDGVPYSTDIYFTVAD